MRTAALLFAILLPSLWTTVALAKPANKAEAQVAADSRMVREFVDLGEYEVARDSLEKSLAQLKAAGSAVRPIAAETHASLGVVYLLGSKDTKKAMEHFKAAIDIKQDVALPDFANDRAKVVFANAYEELHPIIKCDSLLGLYHQAVPLAQEGKGTTIEAKLDKHLIGGTMMIMYRGSSDADFQEAPMSKVEGCTYRGEIPAASVNAPKVEYYLEARLKDGRPSARRGKSRDPFVVNVSFGPVEDAVQTTPIVEEPEEDEVAAGPRQDEVDELLLNKPKSSKGSGCAGCNSGSSHEQGTGLVLLGLAMLAMRRRSRWS